VHRGGDLREPRKLRHVAPIYPELAVEARVQGTVVIDCVIGEDGRVSAVTVLRGHPLLDPAAEEAVRQWRYTATLLNGVPVSVLLTVTVAFRLS
jgi:protein TonB